MGGENTLITGPMRRKPIAALMDDAGPIAADCARARRPRPDRARHRRNHRRRHLRDDRGRRATGRAGTDPVIRDGRRGVHDGGAVLCRVRLDDPGGWQRVFLFVRHDGRAGRMDHRLGPRARVRGRQPPRSPPDGRDIPRNPRRDRDTLPIR